MNLGTLKNNTSNTLLLHSGIWTIFIFTSLIQFYDSPFKISTDFYVQWASGIALFYLNYYYLVPSLLLEKKYWTYFSIVIVLIALFMIIRAFYFMPDFREMPPKKMIDIYGKEHLIVSDHQKKQPLFFKTVPSFFYILILTISAVIKTLSEFYTNQQNKLIAETHRTSTELNYLRKQTNPHFLFNALNSIYSLAYKKSDLVPDAIVTLSELMRYMLYETDNKSVLLEKEINYIQNYLELQKLRLNNVENIVINIHGETKNKPIEPLLLISFIENAFKYGTDYKGTAFVKIKIIIDGNNLDFWVENKIENKKKDAENSGIGLTNIKNRLNLIYSNAHQLTIIETESDYKVHLNLQLNQIITSI